jgi:hypothetical protein
VNGPTLIAGSGPELIAALAGEAERRGVTTALSLISGHSGPRGLTAGMTNKRFVPLEWNPYSPISTRNLILAAENKIGPIETGIIVCAALNNAETHDFSPAGIDFIVNNHIKSYMLLAHELMRTFRAKQNRSLAFVLLEGPDQGILAAPVLSAFKSFSNSMLALSNSEYLSTLAFSSQDINVPLMNEFAGYIFKILDENKKTDRARWFKFSKSKMRPPSGLIQNLRNSVGRGLPL